MSEPAKARRPVRIHPPDAPNTDPLWAKLLVTAVSVSALLLFLWWLFFKTRTRPSMADEKRALLRSHRLRDAAERRGERWPP